jgi:hypothetical protein
VEKGAVMKTGLKGRVIKIFFDINWRRKGRREGGRGLDLPTIIKVRVGCHEVFILFNKNTSQRK